MTIGIDPGVKGGMAYLWRDGRVKDVFSFTDKSEQEISDKLDDWFRSTYPYFPAVYLEKVNTRPGEGHMGAFTFGRVYGLLRGLVIGKGATLKDVYPAMWQSRMECMTAGNKNVSKNKAISLFTKDRWDAPQKITHANADALLIAEYGRRMELGAGGI